MFHLTLSYTTFILQISWKALSLLMRNPSEHSLFYHLGNPHNLIAIYLTKCNIYVLLNLLQFYLQFYNLHLNNL